MHAVFCLQAEQEAAQSELFELRSRGEAAESAQANEADNIALEHEQALMTIR